MNFQTTINHQLFLAHGERSRAKAQTLLRNALQLSEQWLQQGESPVDATILKAQIHADLAREQESPSARQAEWRNALRLLQLPLLKSPDASQQQALAYAIIAVDYFQDRLASQPDAQRLQLVRAAEKTLTEAIATCPVETRAPLLVRKSSVLRKLADTEIRREARLGRIRESKRCVDLALSSLTDSGTALESAMVEWALAQYEETDEAYADQLRLAEDIFLSPLVRTSELGRLAYAEFLRQTYRSLDACDQFTNCIGEVANLRRLLRSSYHYGEAAVSLWFQDLPPDLVNKHLSEAGRLIESSIAAGFNDARMILGLAYISAILNGPPTGLLILRDICPSSSQIDWNQAAQIALNGAAENLVVRGFVLGMDEGVTWSRLGTFFKRFLKDNDLAQTFYRTAILLQPHNPIALTNLARLLLESDDEHVLPEAERLLQRAQNFSDRRFTWWRQVAAQIQTKKGSKAAPALPKPPDVDRPFHDIRQVRQQFRHAAQLDNVQQRGYVLEVLIYELAKMTFGVAKPAYRILRDGVGVISQVDGYFETRLDKYRVECKWTAEKIGPGDIGNFLTKLDVAGLSGLFVSMSGFTRPAIEKARECRLQRPILLMDGQDAAYLFEGQIRFDELLSRKRLHLDQLSDPFYNPTEPAAL